MHTETGLPTIAQFVFVSQLGTLLVRRGRFLGLPAAFLEDTSIDLIARKALGREAIIRFLGESKLIVKDENHYWDGKPVVMNVFYYPFAQIVAPMTSESGWFNIFEQNYAFDVGITEVLLPSVAA